MKFYLEAGKMALGSRLRRLSELIGRDATKLFQLQGLDFEPKWFPVFYVLSKNGPLSVKEVAEQIGHSHPSVSQITRGMIHRGIVQTAKDDKDGRISLLSLTPMGATFIPKMEELSIDVEIAVEGLLKESFHDFWKAMQDIEDSLDQQDLFDRVKMARKARESSYVKIIDYQPIHKQDFKALNVEWITTYFTLEPTDLLSLDHPETYVLNPGGHISMASYKDKIVGTCALIKMDEESFELAKMGVSPTARGKNIGWLLGQAVISKAKELGAKRVYLESNTKLQPAINLYYKLGFKKIVGPPSPYERANIQMELWVQ